MSGYRFCRSDDIPLLVDAYNACYRPFVPGAAEWDVPKFRRLAKEIDLWTSSCMVTVVQDEIAGVMLATKREGEMRVLGVGLRPEFRRAGHGRHMLRSLSAKLAILGPPRMTCEIPDGRTEACAFVEACGWTHDRTYVDFLCPPESERAPFDPPLVRSVDYEDLESAGVLDPDSRRSWDRSPKTLSNRRAALIARAIPAFDGWEAWLLAEEAQPGGERLMLEVGSRESGGTGKRGAELEALLVRRFLAEAPERAVRFPQVWEGERSLDAVERWGFRDGPKTLGFAATPEPA